MPRTPLEIVFDAPADDWASQTLPIGTGRLGATFYGERGLDRVQLNEESLWAGANDYDNALAGVAEDVHDLGWHGAGCFLSGGELQVRLEWPDLSSSAQTDYDRRLDLRTGLHTVTESSPGNTRMLREAYAPHDADVLVLRYNTDHPGGFAAHIGLTCTQEGASWSIDPESPRLWVTGVFPNELRHARCVQIASTNGEVTVTGAADSAHAGHPAQRPESGEGAASIAAHPATAPFHPTLQVTGAHELVLLVDLGTDYAPSAHTGWRGADPVAAITARLDAAGARGEQALRAAHMQQFSALMDRVHVAWTPSAPEVLALPTPQRLERYRAGQEDPSLEQLLFAYGRYLLLSSSRADTLPANLQGVWNDSDEPAWGSDYHSNINVQMNYWAAETCDMPEAHESLVRFLEAARYSCARATRHAFGDVPGWTYRTSQSPFGGSAWEWNTVASAWYMQHVAEQAAFSPAGADVARALELVREVCAFWEARLVEGPGMTEHGPELLSPDGWSPEHGPREHGVAYDQQILRDLFARAVELSQLAEARALGGVAPAPSTSVSDTSAAASARDAAPGGGVDSSACEERRRWQRIHDRLGGDRIGSWGQLQEWREDLDDPTDLHRHTSHLFAVYPGREITPQRTPQLAAAARRSLAARCGQLDAAVVQADGVSGDSRRSWTWPWRAALFARLGEAESAHEMVRGLLRHSMLDNLWATHPPMQLDGSFGVTAAIAEMLVSSHDGRITLLPALPSAWAGEGRAEGLRARGGWRVSVSWADGRVTDWSVVGDRALPGASVDVLVDGAAHTVTA